MDPLPASRRCRQAAVQSVLRTSLHAAAAVALLAAAASCSGSTAGTEASTAAPAVPPPVTAAINQYRDNYSKQIIEIQLTNTTGRPLTVAGAELMSPLFSAAIAWPGQPGGIELPPGQTKSISAPLPAPDCSRTPAPAGGAGEPATVSLRLATSGAGAAPGAAPTAAAPDPYGVLARNNAEMCLAQAAAAVASIRAVPELEVAADAKTAVVRLLVTPHGPAGAADALTIDRIQETTLLAEDPAAPWPRAVTVRAGGAGQELRLGIRPARCDPHAVAEDKVGTLLPLRVSVAGREGLLKIDAGATLRDRIYDFVTTACGRQ